MSHRVVFPSKSGLSLLLAVALSFLLGAACASQPGNASSGTASPTSSVAKSTVSVLYAGSLVNLMEDDLGPAFSNVSGFGYQGENAGRRS